MKGGEISGNSNTSNATPAATAICVLDHGTFNMEGGRITGNGPVDGASSTVPAVYQMNDAELYLRGGEITDNSGGGVGAQTPANVYLSGDIIIKDNYQTDRYRKKTDYNIQANDNYGRSINIDDNFSGYAGLKAGVIVANNITVTPLNGNETGTDLSNVQLVSDDPDYMIFKSAGDAEHTANRYYLHPAYTVIFDSMGGSDVPRQSYQRNLENYSPKAVMPESPSKEGSAFAGWYRDQAYRQPYDFNTALPDILTASPYVLTLYAKWTEGSYTVTKDGVTQAFELFDDALNAWVEGSVLKLLRDAQHNGTIVVDKSKTIDLNGQGLRNTGSGSVLHVSGGTLTVNDGTPDSEHKYTVSDNLATVDDSTEDTSAMTFKGGYITGGSGAAIGGGIFIDGGDVVMNGGTIIGNSATSGGGVGINNGTFNMNGGLIILNKATTGGGVKLSSDDGCAMNISGSPVIKDNAGGDVYLGSGKTIGVTGTLDPAASIGVTTQAQHTGSAPAVITSGLSGKGGSSNFKSNSSAYLISTNSSGEVALVPNTANYTITHYLEKLDGSGYDVPEGNSYSLSGSVGATATAVARTFEGFTFDSNNTNNLLSAAIASSGTTALKLYYTRNSYDLVYSYEGTVPSEAPAVPATVSHKFGETVNVSTADQSVDGYDFSGWHVTENSTLVLTSGSFTMPARRVDLIGGYTARTDTPYTVEHYFENLEDDAFTLGTTDSETGKTDTTATGVPAHNTGFTHTPNAVGSILSGNIDGAGDLVLKLYYARNRWKVVYHYENTAVPEGAGALPATKTYKYGATVTVADTPETPAGYDFGGWHLIGQPATASFEMPDRNVEIVGAFIPRTGTQYRVSHYLEKLEGQGYILPQGNSYVRYGTTDTQATAGVVSELSTGFELDWDTTAREGRSRGNTVTANAGGATVLAGNIAGDGSLELDLYYSRKDYKVTYVYEGHVPAGAGAPPSQQSYKFEERVEIAGAPATPNDYVFDGWSAHLLGIGEGDRYFNMPASDVVLVGHFSPKAGGEEYTVRHYVQKADGTGYELPDDHPHPHEYIRRGTAGVTAAAVPQSYAGFEINWAMTEDAADAVGGTLVLDQRNEPVGVSGVIPDARDGKLTLSIYYDRMPYSVSYHYLNEAPAGVDAAPADAEYIYGASVAVASDPANIPEGYEFSGWHGVDGSDLSIESGGSFEMPARHVEILGSFSAKSDTEYTVTHYLESIDGTGFEVGDSYRRTAMAGSDVSAVPHTFTGFTFDPTADNVMRGTVAGDGSLELELYYTRDSYTVEYTYDASAPANASALPETKEYKFGQHVEFEPNAAPVGEYEFVGWRLSALTTETDGSFIMPARNVTVIGRFEHVINIPYTITHLAEKLDGSGYEILDTYSRMGARDEAATAVPRSFRGFTFDENNENNLLSGTVTSDYELELTLCYARESHNVLYHYEGVVPENAPALPADPMTHKFGETVTILPDVTPPEGYTFGGWHVITGSDLTVENGVFTMPARQVELVGSFTHIADAPAETTVTLNAGDGAFATPNGPAKTVTVTTDGTAPITLPEIIPPTGYRLVGWTRPGDSNIYPASALAGLDPTGGTTFTAAYEPEQTGGSGSGVSRPGKSKLRTITLDTGTDKPITVSAADGDVVDLTQYRPVRPGHAFTGWFADKELKRPVTSITVSGDATVFAGWQASVPELNLEDHLAYIFGYPDGTVRPENTITRAEVATIFFRLLKDGERNGVASTNSFSDVAQGSWYSSAVSAMAGLGIVGGYTDGTFRPNKAITRAEFAAVAARFDESHAAAGASFSDIGGHWAASEIAKAAENGWINGYPDGTFRPNQAITRAEAIALINRVLGRDPQSVEDMLEGMTEWPDNSDTSRWYYLDVQEATNDHSYERTTKTTEKWIGLGR